MSAATATATRHELLAEGLSAPVELVELSGGEGPQTLALLGGVHGDEPEGVLAVRAVLRRLERLPLAGRVLAVPVASPTAWAAGARTSPLDGGNLARAFPGDGAGGETARVARLLHDRVIAPSTFLVDLHSAGADYEMPLFAGAIADDSDCGRASAAAARAFGAPRVWLHPHVNPGRTITAAAALGIPSVYVETGGGGNLRAADLDCYVDGVLRVMARLGMVDAEQAGVAAPPPPALTIADGSGDIDAGVRAPLDGWCATRVAVGDVVAAGEEIAELLDRDGRLHEVVRAARPGMVAMLRRRAAIAAGDLVCVLAPEPVA
jgi:uncharacterized protein